MRGLNETTDPSPNPYPKPTPNLRKVHGLNETSNPNPNPNPTPNPNPNPREVHGLNETASALLGKFNRRCSEASVVRHSRLSNPRLAGTSTAQAGRLLTRASLAARRCCCSRRSARRTSRSCGPTVRERGA